MAAHRRVMPSVPHDTTQYANNRAEVSHQPTRRRERQMQRFKPAGQAQRFLVVHGLVQNLFRVGRHLLRAVNHRLFRQHAFVQWNEVVAAWSVGVRWIRSRFERYMTMPPVGLLM